MRFKDIRSQVIKSLKGGYIQHEERNEIDVKNLLSIGEVSTGDVIRMLNTTRGTEFEISPHHMASEIDVYTFKPSVWNEEMKKSERWYIKCYLLEPDVWFISVHLSGK